MGVQSKKKLFLLLIISIVFAVSSIFAGWTYAEKRDQSTLSGKEKIGTTQKKTSNTKKNQPVENVTIEDLFSDEDHIYLNEQLTSEMLKAAKKQLPEEQQTLVDQANAKFNVLQTVAKLFNETPLKGASLNDNAKMMDDVSEEEIKSILELINGLPQDGFSDDLKKIVTNEEEIEEVDSQSWDMTQGDVAYAAQMLDNVVKDGKVISGFTMEAYQNARTAIDALPEGSDKKAMKKELKKVEDAMTSMGIPFE